MSSSGTAWFSKGVLWAPDKYQSLKLGSCLGWFQRIQQLLFHLTLTGCSVFLLHISLVTLTVDQRRNAGEEQGGTC